MRIIREKGLYKRLGLSIRLTCHNGDEHLGRLREDSTGFYVEGSGGRTYVKNDDTVTGSCFDGAYVCGFKVMMSKSYLRL